LDEASLKSSISSPSPEHWCGLDLLSYQPEQPLGVIAGDISEIAANNADLITATRIIIGQLSHLRKPPRLSASKSEIFDIPVKNPLHLTAFC
jgi:hypothetical protein